MLDLFRLPADNFFGQVVQDEAVAAAKAGDKCRGVTPVPERKAGQVQTDDPALGASLQGGDIRRGKAEFHHLVEIRIRLGKCETQIAGPDLGQLVVRPQPGQRQRRILAGQQDQVQRGAGCRSGPPGPAG